MSDPTQNAPPMEPIPIYILGPVEKPGPGTYNMQKNFVSDTTPINIHLKHNIKEEVNQAPMMGAEDTMGTGPKYSIKGKYEIKGDQVPGCDYMPESFGSSVPPIKIHEKSNNLQQDDVPAPGTYDPSKPFGSDQQGSTMHGTSDRTPYDVNKDSPGPGNYNANPNEIGTTSPRYTIGNKNSPLSQDDVPAPGTYDPSKPFGSDQQGSTMHGTSNRTPYDVNKDSPGPGNYNANPNEIGTTSPRTTIGNKTKPLSQDDVPAPGTYDPSKPFGSDQQGSTMHGTSNRTPYNVNKDTPGPATYNDNLYLIGSTSPRTTIGNKTKPLPQDDVPAPGTYDEKRVFKADTNKGVILSKTKESKPNNNPGPGAYNERPQSPIRDVPPIKIHNKTPQKQEVNDVPFYDTRLPFSSGAPAYTIRGKTNTKSPSLSNGPEYTPPPFGSEARKTRISSRNSKKYDNDVPAPGYYHKEKPFGSDAKATTIHSSGGGSSRKSISALSTPGPGAYSPSTKGSPKIKIGEKSRTPKRDSSGEYRNLGSTLGGPRYSLRSRNSLSFSYT